MYWYVFVAYVLYADFLIAENEDLRMFVKDFVDNQIGCKCC